MLGAVLFFFSSRRRHTRFDCDWSSDVCSSDLRGLTISAVTYLGANRARLAFREEVMKVLAAHDALLTPTAPAPAPEGLASTGDASLCAPWSFAGVPAISLPSGLTPSGLPLAIQLVQAAGASA